MREFLKHNFKTIVQIVAVLLLVILLVRSFTSIPDRSELLKYKLDQLDNNIDSLKNSFSMILVDEAHLCPADMFSTALNGLNAKIKIGISATPKRKDGGYRNIAI